MELEDQDKLIQLLQTQRIACLGTLRNGEPFVSLVLFVAEADFSAFYIHVSRLAYHTQNLRKEACVNLMIFEQDIGSSDPQSLARISIKGKASATSQDDSDYEQRKSLYLAKFPQTSHQFAQRDFILFSIQPYSARYVAGMGRVYNLSSEALKNVVEKKQQND